MIANMYCAEKVRGQNYVWSLKHGGANPWYVELVERALKETENLQEAILSADIAFAIQPLPNEVEIERDEEPEEHVGNDEGVPVDAAFSFDIYNPRAQGILNRAMEAARKLSATARREFERAIRNADPQEMARQVVRFIETYRLQLANLLSTTQLAAFLEGAREVASHVPTIPPTGVGVPLPPTLPPDEAKKLVERLEKLSLGERERVIYNLPPDHQLYVRQSLWASGLKPPEVPPTITVTVPAGPEKIHFPIIEEAVKEMAQKNVMTREEFDRLDAATRQRAFTVTGVDAQETLGKIRDTLAKNVAEGVDYETFRKDILANVDEGTFLGESHLENVFRTNIQGVFSDGQMNVLQNPIIRSGFPYAGYESIHDDRRRPNHGALEHLGIDGTNIYRINDPVFQTFRPPWDYSDRCSWIPYTVQFAAEKGLKEAIKWMDTGVEPSPPAFVPMPPFQPPPGFQRAIVSMPLSIRLSLEPLELQKKPRKMEAVDSNESTAIDVPPITGGQGAGTITVPEGITHVGPGKHKGSASGAKGRKGRVGRSRKLHARLRVPKKWRQKRDIQLAVHRAPRGYTVQKPLVIQGKSYVGGEFIPAGVMAKATPEERAAAEGKQAPQKPQQKPAEKQQTKHAYQQQPVWQAARKKAGEAVLAGLKRGNLSPQKQAEYAKASSAVLNQMGYAALARFAEGTNDGIFFSDSIIDLNNEVANLDKTLKNDVAAGNLVAGVYLSRITYDGTGKGRLHVNGGSGSYTPLEIYAHEFMHAIDGPGHKLSTSQEWIEAWKAEIVAPKAISDYASILPQEGLAEFGRWYFVDLPLIIGTTDPLQKRKSVEAVFPKCAAVLETYGLV